MARRTSFHFPKEAMAQLDAIRVRTHIADNSELIRSALNAYDELVMLFAKGNQMFIRDSEGQKWPYSPYVKLNYPGLKRDEFNTEAAVANENAKAGNFFFSGDVIKTIESLKRRSHLSSNVDAIRVALSAFKELVLVAQAGDSMFVRDLAGREHPYSPFQPFRMLEPEVELTEG